MPNMARRVGIIAYGSQDDRDKLEVLAQADRKSSSAWLVEQIRAQYKDLFGEVEPNALNISKERARHA